MSDAIWPTVYLVIDGAGVPVCSVADDGGTTALAFLHESEAEDCCRGENTRAVDAGREPLCRVALFREVTDG
jgi:hypothetical protein